MEQLDALIVRLSARLVMLEQDNMRLRAEVEKLKQEANGKPDSSS